MKPLPCHPDLLEIAPRIIWFEPAEKALANPVRFLAYVMTYGTLEDIAVMRRHVDDDAFHEVIADAPPGIMDERSWAYWNVMAGKDIIPPMPVRKFSD
jgi:hypothetical protein